jgi:hypothetical protein
VLEERIDGCPIIGKEALQAEQEAERAQTLEKGTIGIDVRIPQYLIA